MVPWFFRLLIVETNYGQLSQLKVYFKDAEVSISVNLGKSWANKFRGKNRKQGSPGASAAGIHGSSLWRSGSQCGAGISSPGEIWLHLEMFLIVLTRRLFDTNIWWVDARGEGCWQTSFNAQDSLPTKSQNTEFSDPKHTVKNLPATQGTQVWSLVRKIPWRRTWQPTPSILAWRISWTEEPGGLQSMGSHRVGHNWATFPFTHL